MRILHIVPTYQPAYNRGGPIWSVHNFNKRLVKKGMDVTIYTTDIDIPKGRVPLEEEVDIDGVKVIYFPDSYPRIWQYWRVGFLPMFLPRHWEYSSAMHKALKKSVKNFDLVHATSTFLSASTLGGYYSRKNNVPYVISPRGNLMEPLELHNPWKKKFYIKLIENFTLKNASAIHFTVEREKEMYLENNLEYKDYILVPNGIQKQDFVSRPNPGFFREKYNIDKDTNLILFLSRISWKKGLDTLIPAMKGVVDKNPDTTLVIAGGDDEGYKKEVEKWIEKNNLKEKVLFTGMITGDEKFGALQDADLFVLPSYSENFGMAVVEAMHFGLPVIITKNVGVAPSIEGADAGIVIEKDEDELVEAILKILVNPEKAKELGQNGEELVKSEFLMEKIADKWIEEYERIIKQKRDKI